MESGRITRIKGKEITESSIDFLCTKNWSQNLYLIQKLMFIVPKENVN